LGKCPGGEATLDGRITIPAIDFGYGYFPTTKGTIAWERLHVVFPFVDSFSSTNPYYTHYFNIVNAFFDIINI